MNHRFNDMPTRNRHRILVYPLLGLFWLAVTTVTAQEVRFEQMTVADGLSNNVIFAVLEDSRGYLWVGTFQGLNRYDGYGMRVYRHIPGDTTSLSHDEVISLHEGPGGTLWVGTYGGGLNRFDPDTETFTAYRHREGDEGVCIWIGTEGGGLNHFDPATGIFTSYQHRAGDPTSLSDDGVGASFGSCRKRVKISA